jgi:hypothetical protein
MCVLLREINPHDRAWQGWRQEFPRQPALDDLALT